MDGNIGTLVEKEIIFLKKLIPIKFEVVDKVVPAKFVYYCGKYLPIEFQSVPHYVPVDFVEIKEPVLIPKH